MGVSGLSPSGSRAMGVGTALQGSTQLCEPGAVPVGTGLQWVRWNTACASGGEHHTPVTLSTLSKAIPRSIQVPKQQPSGPPSHYQQPRPLSGTFPVFQSAVLTGSSCSPACTAPPAPHRAHAPTPQTPPCSSLHHSSDRQQSPTSHTHRGEGGDHSQHTSSSTALSPPPPSSPCPQCLPCCIDVGVEVPLGGFPCACTVARVVVGEDVAVDARAQPDVEAAHLPQVHRVAV